MVRVLKIASGLMGVLLLVMVGVIGVGRYGKDDPRPSLIGFVDYTQCRNSQYALFVPELSYLRPFGASLCGELEISEGDTWFFDGEKWAYFKRCYADAAGELYCRLDRVNIVNGQTTTIIPKLVYYLLRLTEDRKWWVYMTWDSHGRLIWERRRLDGSEPLDLTHQINAQFPASGPTSFMYSPDQQWIYVQAQDANGNEDIYRLRLDGTAWENLTDTIDDSISLYISGDVPSRNAVPISNGIELFYMSYDGREIIPIDWSEMDTETHTYFTSDKLSIMASADRPNILIGLSIESREALWEIENRYLFSNSPDGEWLVWGDSSVWQAKEMMRWDGSEWRVLDDEIGAGNVRWSSDGKWLIYETHHPTTREYQLKRIRLETHAISTIFTSKTNLFLQSETPDGEWFIFHGNDRSITYRMRPDGTQVERLDMLDHLDSVYFPALSPRIGYHWQPPILAAIALTLITTPILLSRLRRRHDPANT